MDTSKAIFNLKAVVKETGLKPDTLRAWERRYKLPQPQRTAGGHRLYSEQDIEILKWLIARQDEGLSISRAVNLWRKLISDGQNPLLESQQLKSINRAPVPTPEEEMNPARPISAVESKDLAELRKAWLSACLAFEEQRAEYILAQIFALYSLEEACFEVLQKGLVEIGEGWVNGEVTVQQEHFTSAFAIRWLETMVTSTPAPSLSKRLVVGCPPLEEHVFGILVLSLLLRRKGYEVVYLGANLPLESLESTMKSARPDLVVLSAQTIVTAATLLESAKVLRNERIPLAFGGNVFNRHPSLYQRIPGYFLGENLEQALNIVVNLLRSNRNLPPIRQTPTSYQEALVQYRRQRNRIENIVWNAMRKVNISDVQLTQANIHIAQNISAALTLGDINVLDNELTWFRSFLMNYPIPAKPFQTYLRSYYNASKSYLGEPGQIITHWLQQLVNSQN